MRKNILKMTLAAAFVCAAGFTAYRAQTDAPTLSELALENVEALAQKEGYRCTLLGSTVFYCMPNIMMSCYCNGARPGKGYYKTFSPNE